MRRILFIAALCAARSAAAGEYVDGKLAGNACVTRGPAFLLDMGGGGCPTRTPWDTYDTRDGGFGESMLLVHPRGESADGRFAVDLVAAFVFDGNLGVRDDSSFLRLAFRPTGWAKEDGAQLLLFPHDSDRLRLGFSRAISWGGSAMFLKGDPPAVPGLAATFRRGDFDAFLGAKASFALDEHLNVQESTGAVLAGAGLALGDLRVDVNGGVYDRGANPKQEVFGQPVRSFGASAQLSYLHGKGLSRPNNLLVATADPNAPAQFFHPPEAAAGLSFLVSAEASVVGTTLMDPDHTAALVTEPGVAGDLQAVLRKDALRVRFTAMYRDLAYLLQNVPGFVPYVATSPMAADTSGNLRFLLGADYRLPALPLTPGADVLVERPATFLGQIPPQLRGSFKEEAPPNSAAVVVRDEGSFDVLPPKADARPVFAGRLSLRLDLLEHFAALLSCQLGYDPNRTTLARGPGTADSPYVRVSADPLTLAANLGLAAGF